MSPRNLMLMSVAHSYIRCAGEYLAGLLKDYGYSLVESLDEVPSDASFTELSLPPHALSLIFAEHPNLLELIATRVKALQALPEDEDFL